MKDQQLYLSIGVPIVFNGLLVTVLVLYMNARLASMNDSMNERFKGVYERLDAMNQRFDDMRDLWRAELRRVEEVIDARLRHLEEK